VGDVGGNKIRKRGNKKKERRRSEKERLYIISTLLY
jgi:hypothetical protein